jgi:hypothetical protein
LRATIIAAIITSTRHRLAILIVARFSPRLSRYILSRRTEMQGQCGIKQNNLIEPEKCPNWEGARW